MLWEKQNDWLFWGWEGGRLDVLPYSSRACRQTGQQQQLHWRIWKNWVALCPHFPTGDKTSQSLWKRTAAHIIYLLTYHLLLCLCTQEHKTLNYIQIHLYSIQINTWMYVILIHIIPSTSFAARHELLRQNTRTELQMRPRCIFPFSRLNRMLPCSVTLDAPLTAHKPCLTPDRSTPDKNHLPLADSFFVLMILAAYSWPDDIFTHRLTTENAPLKKRGKKEKTVRKKMGTRPWCRTDRAYGMESRICAMMEAQPERFQGYTTMIFHGCLSVCVWWACVGVLKLLG